MPAAPSPPINAFVSYAHKDESLRTALDDHLALLKSRRLIDAWYDRLIEPGGDWAKSIRRELSTARLVLLLVTPAFFASRYCSSIEFKRAIARQRRGEATVIPVIMKEGDYSGAPFSHLKELPTDGLAHGRSVTGKKWKNRDEALRDVTEGIRTQLEALQAMRVVRQAARVYREKTGRPPSRDDRVEIAGLVESFGRIVAGRRVLWVDDNPTNNETETAAFQELGVKVATSINTEDALTQLSSASYHLVISDWTRSGPGQEAAPEGPRLLDAMRRSGIHLPVIFYTSWLSPQDLHLRKTLATKGGASGVTASPRELLRWSIGELVRSAALDPTAPFVELPLYPGRG
jgi:CheY-like chemotaxis protein